MARTVHDYTETLEQRVSERTAELTTLNDQLRSEIDERRRVESRLREAKLDAERANLSKTKFLAAVSHDLLQPLNAARLFTSALLERREPLANENLVRNVSNSLEDVENLLGTLVDISKLDAGVIKADIAPFAVSELLQNLAAEYHQIAGSEGLRLDFVPSSALVRSDIQLLARILRNLLSNAIRYTREGRILLGCRRHRQSLSIEVWDTGIGIAEDKLGEIFQEFKRGDVSQRKQDRGLGLGLAIVDKIAGMLGHRIRVSSTPGKGSMFAIDVPLTSRAPRARLEPALPDLLIERLSGARVWVLDNDAAICAGMRTLLEAWGCQVVTALSAEDLARQVDNYHAEADLLIADYHLDDGHNGVDAVALINSRRSTPLPALMITANYSNELKQQIRELGHTLMHKPVRPMKLKTAMSHLLDRGAAGWRMDVAPWVPDDFWREWRTAVKQTDPQAITIAETWFDASKYLLGDTFDSTMNYVLRNAVLDFANGSDARKLVSNIEHLREAYPRQAFHALMNLLSSHDQARALHVLGGPLGATPEVMQQAKQKLRLATLVQMTLPGSPTVYYGDEVGQSGGDDPYNRMTYPWADQGGQPDLALRSDFKALLQLRQKQAVLRRGVLQAPLVSTPHVVVLARQHGSQTALMAYNNSGQAQTVTIDLPAALRGKHGTLWWGAGAVQVQGAQMTLTVPPLGGWVWGTR